MQTNGAPAFYDSRRQALSFSVEYLNIFEMTSTLTFNFFLLPQFLMIAPGHFF